jgi:His-Xaa-Ser system protein HxsD
MASHQIEHFDEATATAVLSLDAGIYPTDVLYSAAYALIDRCYVLLDKVDGRMQVHLRGKLPLDVVGMQALSGEFGNELLSQALRRKIVKQNGRIIEEIVTAAIAGAAGATLPQDFVADTAEDDLDFLDDPLGIAVPWEEKFKK